MKRLIKGEIFEGFNKNDKYLEIFKNPTSKEIEDTKKNDSYGGIRGTIDRDGNKYIWPADYGHYNINANLSKEKEKQIPLDYLRFAVDQNAWIFDETGLGGKLTINECRNVIKNNIDFLVRSET